MMNHRHTIVMIAVMFSSLAAISRADEAAAPPAVVFTIELVDGSRIIGSPIDLAALPVKLAFTQLDIPLHLLASAQFSADRKSFSVKFANNDTLTGSLELSQIKVKTTYGVAVVPVTRIAKLNITIAK